MVPSLAHYSTILAASRIVATVRDWTKRCAAALATRKKRSVGRAFASFPVPLAAWLWFLRGGRWGLKLDDLGGSGGFPAENPGKQRREPLLKRRVFDHPHRSARPWAALRFARHLGDQLGPGGGFRRALAAASWIGKRFQLLDQVPVLVRRQHPPVLRHRPQRRDAGRREAREWKTGLGIDDLDQTARQHRPDGGADFRRALLRPAPPAPQEKPLVQRAGAAPPHHELAANEVALLGDEPFWGAGIAGCLDQHKTSFAFSPKPISAPDSSIRPLARFGSWGMG